MEHFLQFVISYWYLWLMFIIIVLFLIRAEFSGTVQGVRRLAVRDAVVLINRHHAVVIDLRDLENYKNGHIIGAKHVPFNEFNHHLDKLEKFKKKPIILYCTGGQQSPKAGAILLKAGFSDVNFIQGGLAGWREASMPLSKKE